MNMTQVRITFITGETLPIKVYISDILGNNLNQIGTITSTVPPTVTYNSVIPTIFNTAPQIKFILVDDKKCEVSKILDCTFGCYFEITLELESCVCLMKISTL